MKRTARTAVCALLILCFMLGSLTGCGQRKATEPAEIVCTSFAAYDWVRTLLTGTDTLRATLLVADGSDLHSYQPTVTDKVTLINSALIVRVGGESDRWVSEMAENRPLLCLTELDGITLREAQTQSEAHGHEHTHVHEEDGHGHNHDGFDEHLWLSPSNASVCITALSEQLCALDPSNREIYTTNASAYLDGLTALDAAYEKAVTEAARNTLLVADRFPFVYLVEEYGLSYCAAFSGCSTESQASFETVVRLARKADEWNTTHLLVTEGSDRRLAASVSAASEQQNMTVLALDSMQAVSAARASEITYLSVMYENLEILKVALS